MQRFASFLRNNCSKMYEFRGEIDNKHGAVCSEILNVFGIINIPKYFDIWTGGKTPAFTLKCHKIPSYEQVQGTLNGTYRNDLFVKVNRNTWFLNDKPVNLEAAASLRDLVAPYVERGFSFDVFTYGIDA